MIITQVFPLWTNIIVKHTMQKSGDLYISKAYLTYEEDNTQNLYKNADNIENKTSVTVSVSLFNINQIAVKLNQIYDSPVTYNKVYLCNDDNDILVSVATENHKNILNVYDDFIINISDIGELLE